mmetsp:Transcript_37326/g.79539  ORF Transcript_37326/g.79539 Transcript_37326/m.79539 type:complete len:224 (-) Transcript_37326:432-1103(-)
MPTSSSMSRLAPTAAASRSCSPRRSPAREERPSPRSTTSSSTACSGPRRARRTSSARSLAWSPAPWTATRCLSLPTDRPVPVRRTPWKVPTTTDPRTGESSPVPSSRSSSTVTRSATADGTTSAPSVSPRSTLITSVTCSATIPRRTWRSAWSRTRRRPRRWWTASLRCLSPTPRSCSRCWRGPITPVALPLRTPTPVRRAPTVCSPCTSVEHTARAALSRTV